MSPGNRVPIPNTLRKAIRDAEKAGINHYQLGQLAGVNADIIDRFMYTGERRSKRRDMRLETAEKIAKVLGLELRKRG
jgi:hypothetical protein